MNGSVVQLLSSLREITPSELAEQLSSIALEMTQDDWSAVLYGIEDLAQDGHHSLAEQLMSVCLRAAQQNEKDWAVRAVTYFLGHVYFLQGKAGRALEAYQSVVASGMEGTGEDNLIQAALALGSMARTQMAQGYIAEAMSTIKQSITIGERLGREVDVIGDQWTLAGLYLIQEDFTNSEALLRQTLARAKQLGHPESIALTLMRLASLQHDLNQPETAVSHYESALSVLDDVVEPEDEEVFFMTYREALVGLGMAYEASGQPEEAIDYYADASRLAYWSEDERNQAVALTWLGTAQVATGQPKLAIRSFNAAERLAQQSGHEWWLGTNSFFQSSAWQALEKWEEAEAAVLRAMEYHAATLGEHSADEVGCLVKLGEIAVARNAFETAVTHYRQALTLLERVELGQMHRLIYLRLGEAYWYQGDFTKAYKVFRRALAVYESKRQTVSELWTRVDFAPSRDIVYEYLVQTCLVLGKPVEAYTTVEEGRMRVFREQLMAQLPIGEPIEAVDWDELNSLLWL